MACYGILADCRNGLRDRVSSKYEEYQTWAHTLVLYESAALPDIYRWAADKRVELSSINGLRYSWICQISHTATHTEMVHIFLMEDWKEAKARAYYENFAWEKVVLYGRFSSEDIDFIRWTAYE